MIGPSGGLAVGDPWPTWGEAIEALGVAEDLRAVESLATQAVRRLRGGRAAGYDGQPSLERLLLGPPARLDLARAALVVAREEEPGLDLEASAQQLDLLARRLRAKLRSLPRGPGSVVGAVNAFFFEEEGFSAGAPPRDPLDHLLLHRVLARRKGSCLGLGIAYLAIADRLGLPFHGVPMPRHFFVRYDDGEAQTNVELTRKGASFPDAYYVSKYRPSEAALERGLYLANLSKREVVVELLHNLASHRMRRERSDRALEAIELVAEVSRNHALGYLWRGFVYHKRGEARRAIGEYRRALALDERLQAAYVHLGDAHLALGEPRAAREHLARAIALDPKDALAHSNLGRALAREGDLEAALECHGRAAALAPASAAVQTNLGAALFLSGDLERAAAAFRAALRADPRFVPARENLARVLKATGHPLLAAIERRRVVAHHRALSRRTPADDGPHHALARFLLDLDQDPRGAIREVEEALALRPGFPPYLETLAQASARAGDLERATRLVEEILAKGPERLHRRPEYFRRLLDSWRAADPASGPHPKATASPGATGTGA